MKRFLILTFSLSAFNSFGFDLNIMSYNVENLFDAKHDTYIDPIDGEEKDKNDWEFLRSDYPGKKAGCDGQSKTYYKRKCMQTNWTPQRYDWKVQNIAKVIKSVKDFPQILALVEIENEKVVKRLADKLGYGDFTYSEGNDLRGVDVALLWKESKNFKLIKIEGKKNKQLEVESPDLHRPTRPILEVEFLVKGEYPLTVFVNHWPSQGNDDSTRVAAANLLRSRIQQKLKTNPEHLIVAVGDFNTIPSDYPHPFDTVLYRSGLAELLDTRSIFFNSDTTTQKMKDKTAKGTYFYVKDKTWNQLDRFFVSSNLNDDKGPEYIENSYKVHNPKFLTENFTYNRRNSDYYGTQIKGVPRRMETRAKNAEDLGYSDHFGVLGTLKF